MNQIEIEQAFRGFGLSTAAERASFAAQDDIDRPAATEIVYSNSSLPGTTPHANSATAR